MKNHPWESGGGRNGAPDLTSKDIGEDQPGAGVGQGCKVECLGLKWSVLVNLMCKKRIFNILFRRVA